MVRQLTEDEEIEKRQLNPNCEISNPLKNRDDLHFVLWELDIREHVLDFTHCASGQMVYSQIGDRSRVSLHPNNVRVFHVLHDNLENMITIIGNHIVKSALKSRCHGKLVTPPANIVELCSIDEKLVVSVKRNF